jgi:hypothetical protein
MAGPTIVLHRPVRIKDRPTREIDVTGEHLQYLLLDSGVICLRDLDGNVVMNISPSQWSHIAYPHAKETAN